MCAHECPVAKCIILLITPPCLLKYVSIRHIDKPNITNAETILFTYLRQNKPKPTSLDGFKNKAPENHDKEQGHRIAWYIYNMITQIEYQDL